MQVFSSNKVKKIFGTEMAEAIKDNVVMKEGMHFFLVSKDIKKIDLRMLRVSHVGLHMASLRKNKIKIRNDAAHLFQDMS